MVTIKVVPKKGGVITGKFDARFYRITREMPGRKKWHDGNLIFELTAANIEFLQKEFPQAHWLNDDPVKRVEDIRIEAEKTRLEKQLPPEASNFDFKTKPFEKQREAFFISRDKKVFALLMEMGTGKTKVALDTAAYLYSIGEIDTLLIVAPNGVHEQWIKEQIPIHLPDWCEYESLIYKSTQTKTWLKRAEQVLNTKGKLRIIAMHVDAFSTEKGRKFAERVLISGMALWCVDESTRIKTPKAARTKAILKLAPLAKYRRIMSGAPVTKGVHNLFTQFKFLSEDIFGFSSFYSFRNFYCITRPIPNAPFGAVKIVGQQNVEDLQRKIDGHSFRVLRKDCVDLPAKIYLRREVPLTDEQKRLYRELKLDFITQLGNGTTIQAPLALVQMMRLQQILCGFITDENGVIHPIPSKRVDTCLETIEELNGKVIVWCRFHQDLDNLSEAFRKEGLNFVEYSGRNKDTRHISKAQFIEDPDCQIFLGNTKAGGTGTDGLQKVCSDMIYYSQDFDSEARWQSEDRIDRIGKGTPEPSTYIDLLVPRSIDAKILADLKANKQTAEMVLDIREFLAEDGV